MPIVPIMNVTSECFGTLEQAGPVTRYTVTNRRGLRVTLIDYGATLVSVEVPDKNGQSDNVMLGFADLSGYASNSPYFGATCGRYANRIAKGVFELDGVSYQLTVNGGLGNHLHGGTRGFDSVLWQSEPIQNDRAAGVQLRHTSPAGDQGYPGAVTVMVRYTVDDDNQLTIAYQATTSEATPLNLTNHGYWNLGGAGSGDVMDHELTLHASRFLPVDDAMIPTGELAEVAGTAMDFVHGKTIGRGIEQLGDGFDRCLVIDGKPGTLRPVAVVRHPASGRVMEVESTEIGVQLFTASNLDGQPSSAGFGRYEGLCLECSHFPDSPNHPEFPSTTLRPGEVYSQTTLHRFSTSS